MSKTSSTLFADTYAENILVARSALSTILNVTTR